MAVLIDSSLWIHYLRRNGDPDMRQRVQMLLDQGEAAWCPPIRLKLWQGANNDAERDTLRGFEEILQDFPITHECWEYAMHLANRGRAAGLKMRLEEELVVSCARVHSIALAHNDRHLDQLTNLPA